MWTVYALGGGGSATTIPRNPVLDVRFFIPDFCNRECLYICVLHAPTFQERKALLEKGLKALLLYDRTRNTYLAEFSRTPERSEGPRRKQAQDGVTYLGSDFFGSNSFLSRFHDT
uniref:UDENN domain-containing protein n=1 Tax=Steinernema glaseri TaxID=37863 RepID=A0A1I7XZW7_9BILA